MSVPVAITQIMSIGNINLMEEEKKIQSKMSLKEVVKEIQTNAA